MAWALYEPDVGKFVVLGEFKSLLNGKEVPWQQRLGHAWDHEMTDQQKSYKYFERQRSTYISTVRGKFGHGSTRSDIFGPVWAHETPDLYLLAKPMKEIQPFSFLDAYMLCVNQLVLDIVLSFEPEGNIHWPLSIRTKRGKEYDGPFYGLAVTQIRDAIILEETDHDITFSGLYEAEDWMLGKPGKITISNARRDGAHLWREQNFLGPEIMMSDALQDALKSAGVPLCKMSRVREV